MKNTLQSNHRQIQKEQTRALLLATAFDQYAQHGMIATTTLDIARAAGVSHGTVFAHFPTQEALQTAVIEEFGSRVVKRLHELAVNGDSLRSVLQAHLEALSEYEGFYTRLVIERRLLPEQARNVFVIIQSSISFHISQAVKREQQAGLILSQPIHLLFNTWIGLIHYYLTNGDVFAPGGSVLERYGQELLDHYLKLITLTK